MSIHKTALNRDTESEAARFRGCAESSRPPEAQAAAVPGGAGVLVVFLGGCDAEPRRACAERRLGGAWACQPSGEEGAGCVRCEGRDRAGCGG